MNTEHNEKRDKLLQIISKINKSEDPSVREELCEQYLTMLAAYLPGVGESDYLTYENGAITDIYLNWDASCGCSIIEATLDIEQFEDEELEEVLNAAEDERQECIINIISGHGERNETWEDLIVKMDNSVYLRDDTPEAFLDSLYEQFSQGILKEEESMDSIIKDIKAEQEKRKEAVYER